MLSEPVKPPAICYVPTGKVHFALNASGGPEDGSLHGFYTYCGRLINLEKQPDAWTEQPDQLVTCQICQESEEAGRPARELTHCRNMANELLLACERMLEAFAWLASTNEEHDAVKLARIAIQKARGEA